MSGELIQFKSKADREREQAIARARAIYESIFPTEQPKETTK